MTTKHGGARPNTGPKGPRPPRLSLVQTIAALRDDLGRKPAVASIVVARAALFHLEAAQERETELYRLKDEARRWEEWHASYDPIWDAARERGIEIFQPMGSEAWHWRKGGKSGEAPTPGEALLGALLEPIG